MEVVKFSAGGEFLGVSGADGRLRIWDAATSVLKQEFVPASHLTATCTCIEWSPSGNKTSGKKKKRKRLIAGDVVAMGTATGALVLYGVSKAQVLCQHRDAHSGRVTGLSWSANTLLLYSVSEDGYVMEWDVEANKSTGCWRGGKSGLSAVHVFGDGLLTAGHGITLWDLETKTPAKTFTGHPSLISQLEVIPETDYFVTMCHTERHLRIWSVNEKNSVLTLTVPEPPQSFSVFNSDQGQVSVASVTRKGPLHLFKHKLNGPVKKPLLPSVTLKVVDASNDSKSLPVLASYITGDSSDNDVTLLAGYGSWLRLRFEKFPVSSLDSDTVIVREFSTQKKKGKKHSALPERDLVEVPSTVKHLQPGMDAAGSSATDAKAKKRKKGADDETEEALKVEDGELPMEERLTNLTIETPATGSVPDSNNLAHLLSQGLHSKDVRILQSVLSRWDETIISTTVRSLPVQLVIPLLNEIRGMLGGKAQQNHSLLKWLKNIFQIHSAYLMSCPSGEELLGPFMSLLRSREALYPQMCQLKGKLELIKGNIQAKEFKAEQPNEALLVYQDESDDEDKEDDAFFMSDTEACPETDEDLGVEEESNSDDDDDDDEDGSDMEDDDEDDSGSEPDSNLENSSSKKSPKKKIANNHVNADSDDLMDDDDDD